MTDLSEAGSVRTEGDSWDITESVGATALSVAAARAVETATADPLIRDEFAYLLVSTAGSAVGAAGQPGPRVDRRRRARTTRPPAGLRLPGGAHAFLRHLLRRRRRRRNPSGGDPGRRTGLAGLPAGLAGRHHGLRDRPASGGHVQDGDFGVGRRRSEGHPPYCPGGSARRLACGAVGSGFRPDPTDRVAGRGPAALPAGRSSGPVVRDAHRAERARQPGRRRGVQPWFG